MPKAANKLTPKQLRFCREYLVDLNGKQAAIRAGYTLTSAEATASRLLRNRKVKSLIDDRQDKRAEKLEITQERVLAELAKIGFADIRKAATWNDDDVRFTPSDSIDDDTAGAIQEVSADKRTVTTKDGEEITTVRVKVKLADKRAALVDIGKHIGMFRERDDPAPIEIQPLRIIIERDTNDTDSETDSPEETAGANHRP